MTLAPRRAGPAPARAGECVIPVKPRAYPHRTARRLPAAGTPSPLKSPQKPAK
jgi:hypothetical protein